MHVACTSQVPGHSFVLARRQAGVMCVPGGAGKDAQVEAQYRLAGARRAGENAEGSRMPGPGQATAASQGVMHAAAGGVPGQV